MVTAGYSQSLHAVALIHRLAADGHQVVLALNVRVFSFSRLRCNLRQLGWTMFWKKMSNRFSGARGRGSMHVETAPMVEYLLNRGIGSRSVLQACEAVGARHLRVKSLNHPAALLALREAQPDLIVYAGGGILRKNFLESSRLGVINAHGGPLPQFRGMNAVEWPMFHGVRPAITVHFVDTGIDTGAILAQRPILVERWSDVFAERGRATVVGVEALAETVGRIAKGETTAAPQDPAAGRQFFVMALPLLEVLQRWVRAKQTPLVDAAEFRFPVGRVPWENLPPGRPSSSADQKPPPSRRVVVEV